jgi:hypothetical protein
MTSKHWSCPKCAGQYATPRKVQAVLCVACSNKTGRTEQWMKPVTESEQ